MIINPESWRRRSGATHRAWTSAHRTFRNGTRVHYTDATRFLYAVYHVYCSPGNMRHAKQPTTYCNAYSNPQLQDILQIVPHTAWGEFGYPTAKGQGWVGDTRAWELDVNAMSQVLYFYQDPGKLLAKRRWTSLDIDMEIYVSENAEAE